jgi:hypothetical protein
MRLGQNPPHVVIDRLVVPRASIKWSQSLHGPFKSKAEMLDFRERFFD